MNFSLLKGTDWNILNSGQLMAAKWKYWKNDKEKTRVWFPVKRNVPNGADNSNHKSIRLFLIIFSSLCLTILFYEFNQFRYRHYWEKNKKNEEKED